MNSEIIKFIKRLAECVKEYRTLQRETDGTDTDIAHFFSSRNVNWLKQNKDAIKELSKINCERPFMTFVLHYIYQ